jgi:hypothetical protein
VAVVGDRRPDGRFLQASAALQAEGAHLVELIDSLSPAVAAMHVLVVDRMASSAESWRARLEKLRTRRLFGRFFAAGPEKLRAAAARLNVRRFRNLAGCPAP